MDEEREALRYVAEQQNRMDHLVHKIYGPGVRFESLSAFGQHTIEALARNRDTLVSANEGFERGLKDTKTYIHELERKLSEALRDNEDLWHENEELKIELEGREE